jgi:hypothetical protein
MLLGVVSSPSSVLGASPAEQHLASLQDKDDHPASPDLVLLPNPIFIGKGDSKQAEALVVMSDGTKKDVTDSAKVKWQSDNPKTATVDAKGKVVGVEMGITKIKATYGGKTSSIEVTVGP